MLYLQIENQFQKVPLLHENSHVESSSFVTDVQVLLPKFGISKLIHCFTINKMFYILN